MTMRLLNHFNVKSRVLFFILIFFFVHRTDAQNISIDSFKDLYIPAFIIESEKLPVTIVVPENGSKDIQAGSIQKDIRDKSGVPDSTNRNISCNELADSIVLQTATIKANVMTDSLAFIRTEVPGMTNSSWQRNLLYLKETGLIVIDRTTAVKTSDFKIQCSWAMPEDHKIISLNPDMIKSDKGAVISFANQGRIKPDSGNVIKESFSVRLPEGDWYDIGNLVYDEGSLPPRTIRKTGKNNFMISGGTDIFICLGDYEGSDLKISSDFSSIGSEMIFFSGIKEMRIGKTSNLKSDVPVSLLWNIKNNKIEIFSEKSGNLTFDSDSANFIISFNPGKTVYENIKPLSHPDESLANILKRLKKSSYNDVLAFEKIVSEKMMWNPEWQVRDEGGTSFPHIPGIGELHPPFFEGSLPTDTGRNCKQKFRRTDRIRE